MKKTLKRFLSNQSLDVNTLSLSFESLNLREENMGEIARIEAQLASLMVANESLIKKVTELEGNQTAFQNANTVSITEYTDVVPAYTNGGDIQLDAFKVIPEFNGERKIYRSWRSQVSKLMQQINAYKTHPKYAAALSIIRAKITGAASDILINNNTAHNIDAIIDRLDFSYSDQRPLYVIEAEMTMIKQHGKSLQEFYDAINQALNMVLTKIAMTYKENAEQKSLTIESQSKAIRTFITGLNSPLIRTTLYGNMPKTLSQAFAIAQTIQYDNQHLQLDNQYKNREQQKPMKTVGDAKPNFNPNFRYQPPQQQSTQAPKQNNFMQPYFKQQQKPTPMDVDNSKQNIQRTQFQSQQNNFQAVKREREPSFQHMNKQQRLHHLDASDDIQSIYHHDSLDNNCDETENLECASTISSQESTFLEE